MRRETCKNPRECSTLTDSVNSAVPLATPVQHPPRLPNA